MTMRDDFEKWLKDTGSFTDWSRAGGPYSNGDYLKPLVQRTWLAWCAAHERCAKIAELWHSPYGEARDIEVKQAIAGAIRGADGEQGDGK